MVMNVTTNLIEHSAAVVAAIREAFQDSTPCHCLSRDGKLSEKELLDALIRNRHVHVGDLDNIECLPISELMWRMKSDASSELYRHGIRYLPELTVYSYVELLRVPGIGSVKADAIEVLMAKYGLMLRGADPRRLAALQEEEPEPEARHIEATPREIRETCARELVTIAQRLLQHSGALMKSAFRATAGERVSAALKNSIEKS